MATDDGATYRVDVEFNVTQANENLRETGESATEANQALELLKKSFETLKEVIEAPIEQFKALTEAFSELIREYDQTYLSNAKLETTVRSLSAASTESASHVNQLVTALADKSRFDQDQIRDGAALALVYGTQGVQLEKLLTVSANYATFQGTSFEAAVLRVERAMTSGNLVIGRTPQIMSVLTDQTARANEVLDKTGKLFQDLAEKSVQGGAGALIKAGQAFEELKKAIGETIAESEPVAGFFTKLKEILDDATRIVKENKAAFSDVFGRVFIESLQVAGTAAKLFFDVIVGGLDSVLGLVARLSTSSLAGSLGFPQASGPAAQAFLAARDAQDDLEQRILEKQLTALHYRNIGNQAASDVYAYGATALQPKLDAAKKATDEARDSMLGLGDARDGLTKLVATLDNLRSVVVGSNLPSELRDLLDPTGSGKTFGPPTAQEYYQAQIDAQRKANAAADARGTNTSAVTQDDLKIQKANQDATEKYLEDLRKVNQAELDGAITEKEAHEARLKYTQADLASAKDFADGWTLAFAKTQDEAENDAKVVGAVWNSAIDSIASGLTELATKGSVSWQALARSAIASIDAIIIKMLVLKAVSAGLNALGLGIGAGSGAATGAPGSPGVPTGQDYSGFQSGDIGAFQPSYSSPYVASGQSLPGQQFSVGQQGSRPQSQSERPVQVTIVNQLDPNEFSRYLASGAADKHVLNIMRRNQTAVARAQ